MLFHRWGMLLQHNQVLEGIDTGFIARGDQRHQDIGNGGPSQGLKEQQMAKDGLAVLGWVALPSRWVESAIAATLVLAALNNLYPLVQSSCWLLVFCLDLVHGFGFASVLVDLGLSSNTLALVGFNLGV
jgi:hypothetical protein